MKKFLPIALFSAVLATTVLIAPQASAVIKTKVGVAYDIGGPGDKSFNDLAAAGLLRAKKNYGFNSKEVSATLGTESERETRLQYLVSQGFNPVIAVGYRYATAVKKIASENPNIAFGIVDDATVDLLNVASLVFATNESAYLAGVSAALATVTSKIGYIGAATVPPYDASEAGFIAGVKATNSKASVTVKYLTKLPDFNGYNDPTESKAIAKAMIANKVDVIFSAADGSGAGTFAAASGKAVWTIGSDSDQFSMATDSQKKNMLTSTIKRVDVAVYDFIRTCVQGSSVNDVLDAQAGIYGRLYTLALGGVELSTSGGNITKYKSQISAVKNAIISGKVTVPVDGSTK